MSSDSALPKQSEAFRRFDSLVGKLLLVPKAVVLEREAEYKAKAALNPKKRGPKKKAASHGPDAQSPA